MIQTRRYGFLLNFALSLQLVLEMVLNKAMKRIRIFALTCLLGLPFGVSYGQQSGDEQFQHTIERGQTFYAITTMYGLSVDDIYR